MGAVLQSTVSSEYLPMMIGSFFISKENNNNNKLYTHTHTRVYIYIYIRVFLGFPLFRYSSFILIAGLIGATHYFDSNRDLVIYHPTICLNSTVITGFNISFDGELNV